MSYKNYHVFVGYSKNPKDLSLGTNILKLKGMVPETLQDFSYAYQIEKHEENKENFVFYAPKNPYTCRESVLHKIEEILERKEDVSSKYIYPTVYIYIQQSSEDAMHRDLILKFAEKYMKKDFVLSRHNGQFVLSFRITDEPINFITCKASYILFLIRDPEIMEYLVSKEGNSLKDVGKHMIVGFLENRRWGDRLNCNTTLSVFSYLLSKGSKLDTEKLGEINKNGPETYTENNTPEEIVLEYVKLLKEGIYKDSKSIPLVNAVVMLSSFKWTLQSLWRNNGVEEE